MCDSVAVTDQDVIKSDSLTSMSCKLTRQHFVMYCSGVSELNAQIAGFLGKAVILHTAVFTHSDVAVLCIIHNF